MTSNPPEGVFELLNRHVSISHGTFEKFVLYRDLLIAWQSKINLIGPNTVDDVWQRHFLDSLQLLNLIPDKSSIIIDIGSGAGFPGMVLAMAGGGNTHLIEKDSKKVAFLREISRITKTKVTIHNAKVEDLPSFHPAIITARAFAPLGTLLDNISRQVSHGTICLFPKGKNWSMEIEDAKKHWSFDYEMTPSVADNEGVILKLIHIAKRVL